MSNHWLQAWVLVIVSVAPSALWSAEKAQQGAVAASAKSAFTEPIDGKNATAEFDRLYGAANKQPLLSEKQKAALSRYDVYLVPGFLTGFYLQIGKFIESTIDKKDVLNYLREASDTLAELGVKNEQLLLQKERFNTQAAMAKNAEVIVRTVEASAQKGRRVLLISHSKGGNDVLAALLLLQRARKLDAVAGWISIQSNFLGSPVADKVLASEALSKGAKLFLEELGGTLDSLSDITSAACSKFIAANARDIRRLVKTVPILSFASWKPKPDDFAALHPDTILAATRDMMADAGQLNDGLVPTKNAILAGTTYVAKVGIDHAEVAMANQPPVTESRLDRKRFLQVLVSMLLKRLPSAPRT